MKTIKRNHASTLVWSVVLFLFISSSGCALLKQSKNEIPYDFDRDQLPTESNKPLKSLRTKLLENKWLGHGFCLTTQYIVYILLSDSSYRYICGLGAIHESRLKMVF